MVKHGSWTRFPDAVSFFDALKPTVQSDWSRKTTEDIMTKRGRCLCGETRWEFEGPETWSCYCHCDDCRRNCAAPVVAWLGVPLRNFRWTAATPRSFASSKGVQRHFCATCGSPMGFEADHYEGGMHLYAASLEDPVDFAPTFHVNFQSKLPWLELHDDLPKYDGTLLHAPEDLADYQAG
ncbi:GFA family protein [Ruegeria arenilitoris]|uniref:GFA family protein n=1 Tax=Ruegeria arenilitoris TaxID=1173585 RepID=UPI00147A1105|nr:GFA family protein [Ruegeria arenilitoris]